MNILLINNGTTHLPKLQEWLGDNTLEVVDFGAEFDPSKYDLVVLSGGSGDSIVTHETEYQKELELIKSCPVSIIGICFGFEAIVYAFGGKLERLPQKEMGMIEIEPLDAIPFPIRFKQEFEAHHWAVNDLPNVLTSLAKSKDGIEIIRHNTLPIYAFQFHPEMTGDPKFEDVYTAIKSGLVHSAAVAETQSFV